MKKTFLYSLLSILILCLTHCSQEKTEEIKILTRINDCDLSLDEFERQLTEELELNKDYKLTKEAKKEFLEGLIRKELLIQEAKKLKLDRRDKFVKAIERYWESTLIRDIIELKGRELSKRSYVSQDEIEARYREMAKSAEDVAPLNEIQERIIKELKEEKRTRMLEEWINDLRRNAKIEIFEDLL